MGGSDGARSLKTQQRERREPRLPFGCRGHNEPVSLLRKEDFELKPTLRIAPASAGATGLHGEFDPGSGRTLAARLTHASRARTGPSGPGTAANG